MKMRERPRYISDHPAMALVAPALAAVIVTLILVCAAAASGQTGGAGVDYVGKAREAARADRHRESIEWYHKAIEQSPRLRVEVARELGDQYTWAESPDTAIAWYETYLGVYPDDMDANLGKARALSWADRLGESLALYRRLLPGAGEREIEVRLGIARVLSWQDRLWPARREFEAILEDEPGNLDAQIGRAQVINWAGRHREAGGSTKG
jgi:tetratricopeptide (TPR) repeat protein